LSPLRRELEHHFGITDQAELVAREAFGGLGILLQVPHLEVELRVDTGELGIFGTNLGNFRLQAPQAGQALGGEHESRCTYGGHNEDGHRQDAFDDEMQPRHEFHSAMKTGKKPSKR
jgi:hypothetical protein